MELTQLKDYIFDENYQKIIFNFMDTQTKLCLKQVSKDTCNDVEFNNSDLQLCIDFLSENNLRLHDVWIDEYDDDYSEFDDDMINYITYIKNHNKLLELFIAKQKDYNYL